MAYANLALSLTEGMVTVVTFTIDKHLQSNPFLVMRLKSGRSIRPLRQRVASYSPDSIVFMLRKMDEQVTAGDLQ